MQNASKEHLFGNSEKKRETKERSKSNGTCFNAVWNIKLSHVDMLFVLYKDTCLELKSSFVL